MTGITVTLYERVQVDVDGFNAPVYGEVPVEIENVLSGPAGTSDTGIPNDTDALDLYIPKGDSREWTGCRVEIGGAMYSVVGVPEEWIEANVPGPWNRRVRVKRYE